MNEKLLVICGPTATGKTKLALDIALKFNGELISADSRQVYRDLNIGTGKDLDLNVSNIPIYGIDIIDPKEEFSVAQFEEYADRKIEEIQKTGKLPILVGGSGLLVKAVLKGIETSIVPKNEKLRKKYENKTPSELFDILRSINFQSANKLNNSDSNNKRRLIRAIEISQYKRSIEPKSKGHDALVVGLFLDSDELKRRIAKRVDKRIKQGLLNEIAYLISKGISWTDQSMQALGYKQFRLYFNHKKSLDECINDWKLEEFKYAKRQATWFKKAGNICWFRTDDVNLTNKVEELVHKWYSKSENE